MAEAAGKKLPGSLGLADKALKQKGYFEKFPGTELAREASAIKSRTRS
jgi:hypothetical protein